MGKSRMNILLGQSTKTKTWRCKGPVLEVGRTLAARGHMIEFATLDGQEDWVKNEEYRFVTKVHLSVRQGKTNPDPVQ